MKVRRKKLLPRETTIRTATNRMLMAAKAKIARQINALPLFTEETKQAITETPEQIVAQNLLSKKANLVQMRAMAAQDWRRVRAFLRTLPADIKARALANWNRSIYPADGIYLLIFLQGEIKGDCLKCSLHERSDDPELGHLRMCRSCTEQLRAARNRFQRRTEAA